MGQKILVRGSESTGWTTFFRVVGFGLVVAGVAVYVTVQQPAIAVMLAIAGAAVLVCNEFVARDNARQRRWISDTGSGFTITDIGGERTFEDADVTDLTLYPEQRFAAGQLKSTCWQFTVGVGGEREPIEMEYRLRPGQADPLDAMINRIGENLRQRFLGALLEGATIEGGGWNLDKSQLTITRTPEPLTIPWSEIEQVGMFEGAFCIFRRGEERAVARLGLRSRNMPVLRIILEQWLAEREMEEEEPSAELPADHPHESPTCETPQEITGNGLGHILFERRSDAARTTLAVLAVLCFVGAAILLAIEEVRLLGAVAGAVGVALAVAAKFTPPSFFRCHEMGVFQSGAGGETQLRYDEVSNFSYQGTRHFVNGVYQGTRIDLTFYASTATISYATRVSDPDSDLDGLRDHISRVIAVRMCHELAEGQVVRWTSDLAFQPDGIRYTPRGLFSSKEPQVLPYERIGRFDFENGRFLVWDDTSSSPVIKQDVSAANFFPGFFVLLSIFSDEESSEEACEE
jgi:hypothetical protein